MCERLERTFPSRPQAVSEARHTVRHALESWGVNDDDPAGGVIAAAVLVVSELAANAVKSTSDSFRVEVEAHHDAVTVAVADADPRPARPLDPGPLDPGGRGLAIVERIAADWGQRPDDTGKVVWARLSPPTGTRLTVTCST